MNLKELIKEVESLNKQIDKSYLETQYERGQLKGIKQAIKSIEDIFNKSNDLKKAFMYWRERDFELWRQLKKLLGGGD